jgi:acetoacetate decarboxylase
VALAMCFFLCPDVTGLGAHNFAMPCIPVRYGDYIGQFIPYLYTSTDQSLAAYREGRGWPAVLAQTEVTEAGGRVRARVVRNGRDVIRATASIGGEPIHAIDFLPIILYKENSELRRPDLRCRLLPDLDLAVARTSTCGTGGLTFPDPGDDPVARLAPVKVTAALYGSLDDLYPETMRVLG